MGRLSGYKYREVARRLHSLGFVYDLLALEPILLRKSISTVGNGSVVVGITLPFKNVEPGKYQLIMEIMEAASAAKTRLQTDLEFVQ
jgi:hypothetical protein